MGLGQAVERVAVGGACKNECEGRKTRGAWSGCQQRNCRVGSREGEEKEEEDMVGEAQSPKGRRVLWIWAAFYRVAAR